MLLDSICVTSAEYLHTRAVIAPSSSNLGRRGTIVRCILKRVNCSRVMPSVPRSEEAAAAVAQEVVVEAVEDRRPLRRKHTPPAQLAHRMERSTHLSMHNTHWDRIQGVHGYIQRKVFSSHKSSRRCRMWCINTKWQTCRRQLTQTLWCHMTQRRRRSMLAATCPREDNKRGHKTSQRSISRARIATRNSLLLVPSTNTPK